MAGYVSKCDFYDYIKLPIETANDSSVSDTEGYLRITKNQKGGYHGTLSVAAQSSESGHPIKWQNLVHTIDSQDKSIVVTSRYPGEIDLSYAGDMTSTNYLDSSAVVCIMATIDSSAVLDNDAMCYISGFPVAVNPLYRYVTVDLYNAAYEQVVPEGGIEFKDNGRYISIDFDTKHKYVELCHNNTTQLYVRILVGKAYGAVVTTNAPASGSDSVIIVDKDTAVQADKDMWTEFSDKGTGYIDISVGVPDSNKVTSTVG